MSTIPRGIRNNNPFNIRHNPANTWEGMAETQTDPDFVQFTDIVYGIRAGVRLLRNYRRLYNISTVRGLISRHAPQNENNTEAFIQYVCKRLDVSPDTELDLDNEKLLINLADAIIRFETANYTVSRDVIVRGVRMARRPRTVARASHTDSGRVAIGVGGVVTAATSAVVGAAEAVEGLKWTTQIIIIAVIACVVVVAALIWRSRRD